MVLLSCYLFADHTSTLLTGQNTNNIEILYNQELKKLVDWLNANKLTLNIDKSNVVLF